MADIEYKINRLTESLMDDYGKGRVIDEIKMFEYPDRDVVIDILEKLRIVIYPGYYRNRNYRTYTVRNNISILLEDIIYNLIKQTSIVLKYAPEYSDADDQTIAKASEEITFKFLDTIPKITTRTRSSAPTPGCSRYLRAEWLTNCFCLACR